MLHKRIKAVLDSLTRLISAYYFTGVFNVVKTVMG
jgi:hypothetical protein